MQDVIRMKPHHMVDILNSFHVEAPVFAPHPLGHAVHTVSERILADRDVTLEMDLGADDICAPCSRLDAEGLCQDTIDTSYRPLAPTSKREWNLRIDQRWCARLDLQQGDRLTAREFAARVRDRMGDITDIYVEEPVERTADRAEKVRIGIEKFLAGWGPPRINTIERMDQ